MPDQRDKAGNIGDVVKHAILPELVLAWADAQQKDANLTYVETHAGFHGYCEADLWENGRWKGDRQFSLGVLEARISEVCVGSREICYLSALRSRLPLHTYPGSLQLVEETTCDGFAKRLMLVGFDTGVGQVQSFQGCNNRIGVSQGDGYKNTGVVHGAKLVFMDPFWADGGEIEKVLAVCAPSQAASIVWYTFASHAGPALRNAGFCTAEMKFKEQPSGRGLSGAGMAWRGFPRSAAAIVQATCKAIAGLFRAQVVESNSVDLDFSVLNGAAAG